MQTARVVTALVLLVVAGHSWTVAGIPARITVAYLTSGPTLSREDSAAVAWLRSVPEFDTKVVALSSPRASVPSGSVVWLQLPDSSAYARWKAAPSGNRLIATCFENGSRILLTDFASLLLNDLKLEPKPLQVERDSIKNDWLFDKRGFQSFRGHPLFRGMWGGEYVWDPDEDQVLPMVGYFDGSFPESGRVIAVDRAYVFVYAKRKVVFEYAKGSGKLVAVGSSVYFGRGNALRRNLERFMANTIEYLAGKNTDGPVTYWDPSDNIPKRFESTSAPIRPGFLDEHDLPSTGLVLTRRNAGTDAFDVGGRRALVMGNEDGGIKEFWVPPFRVLRDLQVGIVGADSVTWLESYPVDVEARPESFTRRYSTPAGRIKEIIFGSIDKPGCILHISVEKPVRLAVRYSADLRWMWPYDANALGDVHYSFDAGIGAHRLRDRSGDFSCVIGGNRLPVGHAEGQFQRIDWTPKGPNGVPTTENRVSTFLEYDLQPSPKGALNFTIVGTSLGAAEAMTTYRALQEDPQKIYEQQDGHYRDLFAKTVSLTSPDEEFNRLYRWALVGVDRFFTSTPGVGDGLVAGFATSDRGWDGEQKNSGRPGYAWYFGRDSEWSGFAIDDYGDHGMVRAQLQLLQKFQDAGGKIFHEISTSGVVNYDASDAMPLYVVLAGHYLRSSGDLAFVRESWAHLQRAMHFLYSTDTDGDHLIEDTNVGHGWVEGGKLFGVHTELYLAAAWQRALTEMAYIARALGYSKDGDRYESDARQVRAIINKEFWNPSTRFYDFGKFKDGTFNPEPTVMPAVAMYFDVLDEGNVGAMLQAFAGNGFSADWGVRILSAASPLFNPAGYHYGSIWPLFTGWAALGEYAYGAPLSGFTHVMENMLIKNHWELGFVEEVMHGAIYRPSGVCPHQCWSETNIIHPLIAGMLGWRPDAVAHSAELRPQFPLDWDTVAASGLRVGDSRIALRMERTNSSTGYTLVLQEGSPVEIALAPGIPPGMHVTSIRVNGERAAVSPGLRRGVLSEAIRFRLADTVRVLLGHGGGIGLCPVILRPTPGDSSAGYRIVSESVDSSRYSVTLEGRSGTSYTFRLRSFGSEPVEARGAVLGPDKDRRFLRLTVDFAQSDERFSKSTVVLCIK